MDRKVFAWALYDFANSSYSAVIAAVIFPVYYANIIVGNADGMGDIWWGRAISLSMLLVSISSPFIGGIADASGKRKRFLILFTLSAIVLVTSFVTLRPGMVITGFILIVLANTGVEGGFVFYNSYLPQISDKHNVGRISAIGFAVGYVGSIISLLIALYFINIGSMNAIWIEVSVLFLIFSMPIFFMMPSDKGDKSIIGSAKDGLIQTIGSIRSLLKLKQSRLFLLSYFLYSDGVNTVIVFASIFAVTTLGFSRAEAVILFIVVQGFAFIGSMAASFVTDRLGAKRIVQFSILVWISVVICSYIVESKDAFFIVAALAGSVLGSIQSASRALFTMFVPKNREAEFFGSYATVGKASAIIGPLVFGLMSAFFHSQRPAVLSVGALFVLGFFSLIPVKISAS
ncbi:MAG: MFS transporter [Nitrospirota bacterium]|nr:MAG: MFS transporter [Nitrospirota bacterium]